MTQISGKIMVHLSFNDCIGLGVGNNGSTIFISGTFEFFLFVSDKGLAIMDLFFLSTFTDI